MTDRQAAALQRRARYHRAMSELSSRSQALYEKVTQLREHL
jgi:hypothetical protein